TSTPLDRRTRATLRRAEFGFFGVVVYTRVHTPRRWGEPLSAGVLFFDTLSWRPLRTSWLIVRTWSVPFLCTHTQRRPADAVRSGTAACAEVPGVACPDPARSDRRSRLVGGQHKPCLDMP